MLRVVDWNDRPLRNFITRELERRMFLTVTLLKNEAQRICPYRTGHLRGSLQAEVEPGGRRAWYGSRAPWRGEASVYYALFVELGTRRMSPRPYLRPPLQNASVLQEIRRIWQWAG